MFDFSSRPNPRAVAKTRGLPNGDAFFWDGNWPRMGALGLTGVPREDIDFLFAGITLWMTTSSFSGGWLYIQVATSTVVDPMRNEGVILKPNNATDAKNERTIDKLVAKPFRILSEYLMTMAVINPPSTWIATVAQAQPPKFLKIVCDTFQGAWG